MFTTTRSNLGGQQPVAKITKSKNQLKSYNNDSTIFLNNGDEFEIMLYNPTKEKYLAKIQINGKDVFSSGLIIKPGQRVFLERFFDEPKKFKFETYEVEGDSLEIKEAIKNNGDVKVEFFKENAITYNYVSGNISLNNLKNYDFISPLSNNLVYSISTNVTGALNTNITTSNTTFFPNNNNINYTNNVISSSSLETGRIEKGGDSKQEFINDYSNFESYCSASSTYKILPCSQKPIEISEIRSYCSNCGVKIKSDNWKFCPKCGTKVE